MHKLDSDSQLVQAFVVSVFNSLSSGTRKLDDITLPDIVREGVIDSIPWEHLGTTREELPDDLFKPKE